MTKKHLLECATERRGCRMSCVDSDLYNDLFGFDPAITGLPESPRDPEQDARIVESLAYDGTEVNQ